MKLSLKLQSIPSGFINFSSAVLFLFAVIGTVLYYLGAAVFNSTRNQLQDLGGPPNDNQSLWVSLSE